MFKKGHCHHCGSRAVRCVGRVEYFGKVEFHCDECDRGWVSGYDGGSNIPVSRRYHKGSRIEWPSDVGKTDSILEEEAAKWRRW